MDFFLVLVSITILFEKLFKMFSARKLSAVADRKIWSLKSFNVYYFVMESVRSPSRQYREKSNAITSEILPAIRTKCRWTLH